MTPKLKKRKHQKKASPIQSKDIKIIVIDSSKRDKKKQEVKKKGTKIQISKLQKFQAQMIPQNNVDQIRLQHISSKIQQNYRTQNQSYLLKIKNLYDQYKSLILKYTLLTELDDFTFALDLIRKTIINTFINQIKQSFTFQKKIPIQIIAIDQIISISQKYNTQTYQQEIQTLLKPIFKQKTVDQAYVKLKIMMQQRNIQKKLEEKNQLFQNLKDQSLQNCFDNEMGDLHFSALNYNELLEAQQKQELIANAKAKQQQQQSLILDGFFKNCNLQNPKQQINSIRQFLIKPIAKQQMEISKISAKSRNQSKESYFSRNDQYITPFQSNILQLKSMPYQNQDVKLQQKQNYLPNLQSQMSRIQNLNNSFELPFELESQTSCTPANAKKTMLVQNRQINKIGCEGGEGREIDKYSYNSRKQIQNSNLSVNRNDINQSQLFNYQNRSVDFGRQLGFSNLYNSKMFNVNNNNNNQINVNNNLQFSKIQSLHASTIVNDWLSESSQSRLVLQQQHMFQQYNWIIFTNENSNMRFNRQINIQNLKLLCVQIDSNFFDDYEYILLSDKFKILIMEQKDLVSPEMHMRLGKGDEKGAIQALINKMKIQMQQFMLQYNSRQVIVLIQYQHQFFLRMLIEYIFPQLGQLQEQYKITPFYQIEELQEIIFDLIQTQENIRYDRQIKVPNDLNKFRSKIQNIEFSNLVTMRCLNQLYQTLVQQLTN